MKTHNIDRSNSFLPTTNICVTNRGENTWGISMIFDEYIYWVIVLLNGSTLLTHICQNGSKNQLQTRPAADCARFCSLFRRYFSLFMRYISQVRRFVQPPCIKKVTGNDGIISKLVKCGVPPLLRYYRICLINPSKIHIRWYNHLHRGICLFQRKWWRY